MKHHVKLFLLYSFLWFVSLVLVSLIFNKNIIKANNVYTVLKTLPMGLLFTLIQCLIEEIIFRGWYFIIRKKTNINFIWYVLISGFLFSLFHIFNTEVSENTVKILILFNYFIIGSYFMFIAIKTESLASSYGAHFGNNMFTFFLVSSLNSSAPFPSVFKITLSENNAPLLFTTLALELGISSIPILFPYLKSIKNKR